MVLNTMEGGIMQARSRGDVAPFDAAVRQLRHYFDYLERDAAGGRAMHQPPQTPPRRGGESS
jgi:hypothetical protein